MLTGMSLAGCAERAIGFEPTTSSLGSWHSTAELRPPIQGPLQRGHPKDLDHHIDPPCRLQNFSASASTGERLGPREALRYYPGSQVFHEPEAQAREFL